mmetsp:Transcript_3426/g.3998  ORF Transcript_3426/g.3998 Transcript_3426/m.3998 type:complete len:634 (+) Transcript_3426:18-1919(+)
MVKNSPAMPSSSSSSTVVVSKSFYLAFLFLILSSIPREIISFTNVPLQCSFKVQPRSPLSLSSSKQIKQQLCFDLSNNHYSFSLNLSTSTEEEYQVGNGFHDSNENNDNKDETQIYKTRTTILEHALRNKSEELQTLQRRNILLQDVVQKLHLSNRNLLEKINELQKEKEGMHITTETEDIWPPDMQIKVLRDDYNAKEIEWQYALDMAHWKYTTLKGEHYNVQEQYQELINDYTNLQDYVSTLDESNAPDGDNNNVNDDTSSDGEGDSEISNDNNIEIELLRTKIEEQEIIIDRMKAAQDKVQKQAKEEIIISNDTKNEMRNLHVTIKELEKENETAKKCIEDLHLSSTKKRESVRNILDRIMGQKIDLETRLNQTLHEVTVVTAQLTNTTIEAEKRREEEEVQAKMYSKESLDIATAAVRQAKSRGLALKKKIRRMKKSLRDTKGDNIYLNKQLEELKSIIEAETINQNDQHSEWLSKEENWNIQIDKLTSQLHAAEESRDILSRHQLRLKEEMDKDKLMYQSKIEDSIISLEQKNHLDQMKSNELVEKLQTEVQTLKERLVQQDHTKLYEIEVTNGLNISSNLATDMKPFNEVNVQVSNQNIGTRTVDGGKPRRFKMIRKRVRKIKEWLR